MAAPATAVPTSDRSRPPRRGPTTVSTRAERQSQRPQPRRTNPKPPTPYNRQRAVPAPIVPPPPPTNGVYAPGDKPADAAKPIYVGGYRIPGDNVKWFLAANVAFVLIIVIITIFFIPMGIPFLAVKKAEGFLGYIGFFFTYMFGYFAFFIVMMVALGAGSYAVQQKYFA